MRRRNLIGSASSSSQAGGDLNVIYFTTVDGATLENSTIPTTGWGANLVEFSYWDSYSLVFDGPVTTIPYGAFAEQHNLYTITFPKSVVAIAAEAFSNCTALPYIVMPDGITTIGAGAFRDCGLLTDVVIPASVVSVGQEAFSGCAGTDGLNMWCLPNIPPIAGVDLFSGTRAYCWVPMSSLEAYETAEVWSSTRLYSCVFADQFGEPWEGSSLQLNEGDTYTGLTVYNYIMGHSYDDGSTFEQWTNIDAQIYLNGSLCSNAKVTGGSFWSGSSQVELFWEGQGGSDVCYLYSDGTMDMYCDE